MATATRTIMSSVRLRSADTAPVKKIDEAYRTMGRLSANCQMSRSIPNGVASSVPSRFVPTIDHRTMGIVNTSATTKRDRKSTRLNSSHTEIYTLSLHDALPIFTVDPEWRRQLGAEQVRTDHRPQDDGDREHERDHEARSEEHTSELQSHRDLHSFPTRRSSDLHGRSRMASPARCRAGSYRPSTTGRWGS